MKVIRVVFNVGEQRMFVLCELNGFRKNIKFEWMEKIPSDLPPASWLDTVRSEMEDLYRKQTSGLPF